MRTTAEPKMASALVNPVAASIEQTDFVAVVDTNVLLDIYSCHDAFETYRRVHSELGVAALDELPVVYRRARARESLLLAAYFNKIGATTFNLHNEVVALLTKRASPARGGETPESDFTTVFFHFVKDYLLPDWQAATSTEPGNAAGNDADRLLLAYAKQHDLPLITNEGSGPDGIVEDGIRKRARKAGVRVHSPREFYHGKINEAEEVETFLSRFREKAPRYLEARTRELGEDNVGEVLSWIYGYYRYVLIGDVEGRDVPVQVTLSPTQMKVTGEATAASCKECWAPW